MRLNVTFNGSNITLPSPCDTLQLLGELAMQCLYDGTPYSYAIECSDRPTLYGDNARDDDEDHNDALNQLTNDALIAEGYNP
jgi:hypothetical protein